MPANVNVRTIQALEKLAGHYGARCLYFCTGLAGDVDCADWQDAEIVEFENVYFKSAMGRVYMNRRGEWLVADYDKETFKYSAKVGHGAAFSSSLTGLVNQGVATYPTATAAMRVCMKKAGYVWIGK
jgi:hypothetical protein